MAASRSESRKRKRGAAPQQTLEEWTSRFCVETEALSRGATALCGVDEVGRGPLVGPVVAAAVVFPAALYQDLSPLYGLDDSKRLTPTKRAALVPVIKEQATGVGIGEADVAEIEHLNIRQASLLAMTRALDALSLTGGYDEETTTILVDGRDVPDAYVGRATSVIKGDRNALCIAAASVIAKEYRDRLMRELAESYPGYGWERNAGYPTRQHLEALKTLGVTPEHRTTFAPVRRILEVQ
ncbi:MAG: ribonuclease HII [Magnetococcales bacterium]|nr:ribonuclease HII [Magnetococcales bacterium]